MKRNHPIVGSFITASFDGQHRVAYVERIRFPRGNRPPILHVRLHGGGPVETPRDWAGKIARYKGPRKYLPVICVKTVCCGDGEAWIDAYQFFEWAESHATWG